MDVRLHAYHPTRVLLLLEYIPTSTSTPKSTLSQPPNVLLFIGGMYDNFRSPRYVDDIAKLFPRDVAGTGGVVDDVTQKWSVFHVQLSSAGRAFGIGGLDRDVSEISEAITYIRNNIINSPSAPVVIMGHSTGCQDSMHYLCSSLSSNTKSSSSSRPPISGIILQAPVSDREAILDGVRHDARAASAYNDALAFCKATPNKAHSKTLLPWNLTIPILGPVPLTVTRFLSLASPESPSNPAQDDYFSSDLGDDVFKGTFGKLAACEWVLTPTKPADNTDGGGKRQSKSMLILISGDDEHVSSDINKLQLLSRWTKAVESQSTEESPAIVSPHSQVVEHALHDISGDSIEARTARLVEMRAAVLKYLNDVVGDVYGHEHGDSKDDYSPWGIWKRDKEAIEAEKGLQGVKL
ncbi:hypothetical protein PV10_04044 [Exophiala mesophila]|uniref:DUF1749-domain-containing protein n=1 Tax=Exophiala mesophila TaxID=212818 RepID=A0A0D2A126_EXOME|nr:uncharacterized protein PV10_04044 [Exophiala mesophila]KIV92778.1 hypothetical protein PV10_04044 [Exophiala mesophila]